MARNSCGWGNFDIILNYNIKMKISKAAKILVSLEKKWLLLALILFLFLKCLGVIPFRALIKAIKLKSFKILCSRQQSCDAAIKKLSRAKFRSTNRSTRFMFTWGTIIAGIEYDLCSKLQNILPQFLGCNFCPVVTWNLLEIRI